MSGSPGTEIPSSGYEFPVDATHLLFFARALGDPSADTVDHRTAPAPPTFTAAHVHFMADYPLRPRAGRPWIGSGRVDSAAPAPEFGNGLHAEQGYVYHRPIRAGLVLRVSHRPGRRWIKPRRAGGHLVFSETLTDFHDVASGELMQSATQVAVVLHSDPAPSGTAVAAPPPAPPRPPGSAGSTTESREVLIADGLTRSQLVMYAGASGDYNPLHTDEIFATRVAGYPSVFAHGMWTMGASARVLEGWFDADALRSYRASFRGQVWPGDTLVSRATIVGQSADAVDLDVVTTTGEGRVVMTGGARVARP